MITCTLCLGLSNRENAVRGDLHIDDLPRYERRINPVISCCNEVFRPIRLRRVAHSCWIGLVVLRSNRCQRCPLLALSCAMTSIGAFGINLFRDADPNRNFVSFAIIEIADGEVNIFAVRIMLGISSCFSAVCDDMFSC